MEIKLYSCKHNKLEVFHPIQMHQDDQIAKHMLMLFVNSEHWPTEHDPIDFEFFEVGKFDNQTGKITPTEPPRHLINVRSLVKDEQVEKIKKEVEEKNKKIVEMNTKKEIQEDEARKALK